MREGVKGRATRPRLAGRLARQQEQELAAVAAMDDSAVDLSDVPEVRDWSGALVGRFYRAVKEPVTLRLDADVVHWFRARGPGYQTRINRVLRAVMEAQTRQGRGRK